MSTKTKKELTIEMFEEYMEPSAAKQLWNLLFVKNSVCLESTSIMDLLSIPGMGRTRALALMEAVCDLMGKK